MDPEKSNDKLVRLFSIQSSVWSKDQETPLSSNYTKNDIEQECFQNGVDNSVTSNLEILPMEKEDEFRKAKEIHMKHQKRYISFVFLNLLTFLTLHPG